MVQPNGTGRWLSAGALIVFFLLEQRSAHCGDREQS
jgi:hypothetical protein